MEVRRLRDSPPDRRDVASFMARLNSDSRHRIGYCDETPQAVMASFDDFHEPIEETFWLATNGRGLAGVLGLDSDASIGRCWLWGPFVDGPDWGAVAAGLWTAAAPNIPSFVTELEMFYDVANENCDGFARLRGFELLKDDVSILQLERSRAPEPSAADALPAERRDQLAKLHDRLFPGTFLPSSSLFDVLDDTHRVFVETAGGELTGYVYGEVHPDAGLANLTYVGVPERARGRGAAQRLVRAFAAWAFAFDEVNEIALTVDRDNAAARHIYAKLGFDHLFDARAMGRAWP